eukprot:m.150372 g.150372  ORF g.150372 m.150372 type:complete len:582 (+) comp38551_c0_seq30:63-1808(+)
MTSELFAIASSANALLLILASSFVYVLLLVVLVTTLGSCCWNNPSSQDVEGGTGGGEREPLLSDSGEGETANYSPVDQGFNRIEQLPLPEEKGGGEEKEEGEREDPVIESGPLSGQLDSGFIEPKEGDNLEQINTSSATPMDCTNPDLMAQVQNVEELCPCPPSDGFQKQTVDKSRDGSPEDINAEVRNEGQHQLMDLENEQIRYPPPYQSPDDVQPKDENKPEHPDTDLVKEILHPPPYKSPRIDDAKDDIQAKDEKPDHPRTWERVVGCDQTSLDQKSVDKFGAKDKMIEQKEKKRKDKLEVEGISEPKEITAYAQREWKGPTPKAEAMLRGYQLISSRGFKSIRRIRGDNYCALRASLFQALVQNIPAIKEWRLDHFPSRVFKLEECKWLREWSFAERIPSDQPVEFLGDCLGILSNKAREVLEKKSYAERVDYVARVFNDSRQWKIPIALLEAVKYLMLESAVKLFDAVKLEKDTPYWAHILFARDTSLTPEALMRNHLNKVGDTGGLEQIEMFLLGYTLNATIRVMRPSQEGKPDFISKYPDDYSEECSQLDLVAEDDRHYNILTAENTFSGSSWV